MRHDRIRPPYLRAVADGERAPTPRTEEEQHRAAVAASVRQLIGDLREWLIYVEGPPAGRTG